MVDLIKEDGRPEDKSYLECGLPEDLQKEISDYLQAEKEHSTLLDCYWGEVYGSINAYQWADVITKEQADYLRAKYLFGEEEDD